MMKNLFWMAIVAIFILEGCGGQPSAPKRSGYALDVSKTVGTPKDGVVKKYASNGQPWSVETYKNGVKNGPATYYTISKPSQFLNEAGYNNGNAWIKETCSYKNGKKHGISTIYGLGLLSLKNDQYHWVRYAEVVSPYKNGKINGVRKTYGWQALQSKKPYLFFTAPFVNGKKNGVEKTWSGDIKQKNHVILSQRYKNGRKTNGTPVSSGARKDQRNAACRYVDRYILKQSSPSFNRQKYNDGVTICKYGDFDGAYTTPFTY